MSKKRRKFSAEFKFDTVMEGLRGEKNIAQICRERGITASLYYKWKQTFIERAPEIFEDERQAAENNKEQQIARVGTNGGAADDGSGDFKKSQELAGHTTDEKRAMIDKLAEGLSGKRGV